VRPEVPPASMRSYCKPSSSQHHSTFWTFMEFFRPQIFSTALHRRERTCQHSTMSWPDLFDGRRE
jgi:hypothetical protein